MNSVSNKIINDSKKVNIMPSKRVLDILKSLGHDMKRDFEEQKNNQEQPDVTARMK